MTGSASEGFGIVGVEEPEGPFCLEDGSFYIVEMSRRRHCVTHVSADGRSHDVVATAGRPNGLAVDGNIWIAEASEGALLCVSPQGHTLQKVASLNTDASAAERIQTRSGNPTNIAFRRRGREAIVTGLSASRVELMAMPCEGPSLHSPEGLVA